MAKSNAMRRLESILKDEDYGPKLVRLNRKDEAYVLDLIDRNKGREARKEILRLDRERIARRRKPTRKVTAKAPTSPSIEQLRAKAYARLRAMLKGRPSTVQKGVDLMTPDELGFALSANGTDLRAKAKDAPIPYPELDDDEFNVFWYH